MQNVGLTWGLYCKKADLIAELEHMRRSIFGELSAIEQEIEKVSRLYNSVSDWFVESLWRMHRSSDIPKKIAA